jgi:hypothetical protein
MIPFSSFLNESNYMYHGSQASFDSFYVNQGDFSVDRAIGIHFAADPDIAEKFANAAGLSWKKASGTPGFVYKTRSPPDSKVVKVPQGRGFDQSAIGAFIAATVFDKRKDLFIKWLVRRNNGQLAENVASEIYDLLKQGKAPADKKYDANKSNYNSIRPYVADFDSGLIMAGDAGRKEIVQEFDRIMASRGIDALSYQNTSPTEKNTGLRSNKCYILLTHALPNYKIEKVPG